MKLFLIAIVLFAASTTPVPGHADEPRIYEPFGWQATRVGATVRVTASVWIPTPCSGVSLVLQSEAPIPTLALFPHDAPPSELACPQVVVLQSLEYTISDPAALVQLVRAVDFTGMHTLVPVWAWPSANRPLADRIGTVEL